MVLNEQQQQKLQIYNNFLEFTQKVQGDIGDAIDMLFSQGMLNS